MVQITSWLVGLRRFSTIRRPSEGAQCRKAEWAVRGADYIRREGGRPPDLDTNTDGTARHDWDN
ncbi:hypothetical protein GCM10009540_24060 [Streptomyces turgidiscabies]